MVQYPLVNFRKVHHRDAEDVEKRVLISSELCELCVSAVKSLVFFDALDFAASILTLHRVIARAVVPQNFSFVVVGEWQTEKMVDCLGISRVDMRIVGGEHQVAVADLLSDVVGNDFIGFDGDDTVTFEVFAGFVYILRRHRLPFPAFVETP